MVRLLHLRESLQSAQLTRVSIPQWCDCCAPDEVQLFESLAGFNPTMVRLLPAIVTELPRPLKSFNPTMVRLLQFHRRNIPTILVGFNPTMVRLLLRIFVLTYASPSGFNPTMVRLLQLLSIRSKSLKKSFQSHNGAIAAQNCYLMTTNR